MYLLEMSKTMMKPGRYKPLSPSSIASYWRGLGPAPSCLSWHES